jgi:hypothetical protein
MDLTVLTAGQEKVKAAKPSSDFKECENGCPVMIVIPAGRFMMGSPENEPDRRRSEGPLHVKCFPLQNKGLPDIHMLRNDGVACSSHASGTNSLKDLDFRRRNDFHGLYKKLYKLSIITPISSCSFGFFLECKVVQSDSTVFE